MNKHHKRYVVTGLLSAVILTPLAVQSGRAATTTEPVAEQADITNWIANTPEQISANMSRQNINLGDLNGTRYVVQWGTPFRKFQRSPTFQWLSWLTITRSRILT